MFSFFRSHGSDAFFCGSGAVQGSFRATLGVALPLFMSSYDQHGGLGDVPRTSGFFSSVLI